MALAAKIESATGLSQSELLVGALLAGFVLWLLLTKRLQAYWQLLTGGSASTSSKGIGSDAAAAPNAPGVTPTQSGNAGTSAANALSFIPGSVEQFGTAWTWRDATTGAMQVASLPPKDYVPPTTSTNGGTGGTGGTVQGVTDPSGPPLQQGNLPPATSGPPYTLPPQQQQPPTTIAFGGTILPYRLPVGPVPPDQQQGTTTQTAQTPPGGPYTLPVQQLF